MLIAAAGGNGKRNNFTRILTHTQAKKAAAVSGKYGTEESKILVALPQIAHRETKATTEKGLFAAQLFLFVSSVKATRRGGATQNLTSKRIQKNEIKATEAILNALTFKASFDSTITGS